MTEADAKFFLGFDGGGTKTECVLMDGEGQVLVSARSGPSNPLRTGYPKAWLALSGAADAVLARKKLKARDITGICAGLGGAARHAVAKHFESFFRKAFPKAHVRVTTDLEIALAAAVTDAAGIVLIGGTGSAAYGRNLRGDTARAGGRGPWFGDEGSAYDVGRHAVAAVVRAQDGLGPATRLADRILPGVRCRDWNAFAEQVSANPDQIFTRIFPIVIAAAEEGDAVARELLINAAQSLAALAGSVASKLGLGQSSFPIVKMGGMFGRSKILDAAVDERLLKIAPHVRIEQPRISSAQAAAELARRGRDGARLAS